MSWAERARMHFSQKPLERTDKTDKTRVSSVLSVPPQALCEKTMGVSSVLSVGGEALFKKIDLGDHPPANDPGQPDPDPDRWCWPHSEAMNGAEVERMISRLDMFARRGIAQADAEALADQLVIRDREQDDRHCCAECTALIRSGTSRCCRALAAGLAGAGLPSDLVVQLQRCPAFQSEVAHG